MSYFPYQPPPHVVQLSVQHINITKSADWPSAAEYGTSSKSSSNTSYPQETSRKAKTPEAKAALEAKIQTKFRSNLSEHHAEYIDQYKDLEVDQTSSESSSDNSSKLNSNLSKKYAKYMDQDEDKEVILGVGFNERPVGPGMRRDPEGRLEDSACSGRMKKESSKNVKVKESGTRKPRRNRQKSKGISSHRQRAGGGRRGGAGFDEE